MEIFITFISIILACVCFVNIAVDLEQERWCSFLYKSTMVFTLSIFVIVGIHYHRHIVMQDIPAIVTIIEIINSKENIYEVTTTRHHPFYSNMESTYITTILSKLDDVVKEGS